VVDDLEVSWDRACNHMRPRKTCNACKRGDTAPVAWRGEMQVMDPIVRDVKMAVELPPILVDL